MKWAFLILPGPVAVGAQTGPTITQDLTNQTVLVGNQATLSVTVSGTGPFTYQWQFNGTNLSTNGIISTVAGGTTALSQPHAVAVDAYDNLFIADTEHARIREVAASGGVTTVAGTGQAGYSGDGGAATAAMMYFPYGVAVDTSGDIFIPDGYNDRIRKVWINGIITTVAGVGIDGVTVAYPEGVAVDADGNLFIVDTQNQRIRELTKYDIMVTVAGTGSGGYSGDRGAATSANLNNPSDVAVDSHGNLFIADTSNQRIRKVGANGIITTVAGNGTNGYSGDGGAATNAMLNYPFGVAVDAYGDLFIADQQNNRIREIGTNGIITTVAGKQGSGYSGDGGAATNASLYYPCGVAVDAYGNLFIADTDNNQIRKVIMQGPAFLLNTFNTNGNGNYDVVVTSPYGSATSSVVTVTVVFPPVITAQPQSQLALVGGNAAFSVSASGTAPIFYQWYFGGAPLPGQTNMTLALSNVNSNNAGEYQVVIGNPYASVSSSLAALSVVAPAVQTQSQGVKAGSNDTLSATVFGPGPFTYQWQLNGTNLPASTITTVAGNGIATYSGDGGAATNASLNSPRGVAVDAFGNLYIADEYNHRIREVGINGIITTVAGKTGSGYSGDGGAATNANLSNPYGVAVSASGNVFIADQGNGRIREVTYGIILTVAGGGTNKPGDGGLAINANIGATSVTLDAFGNLFIAEGSGGNLVQEVYANGIIAAVAGIGQMYPAYAGDGGPATAATLGSPYDVAVDAHGNLFIADQQNNRIRKVGTNGIITTVAGNGEHISLGDGGAATNANLSLPYSVALDTYGDLFIADTYNNRIREVGINGIITTVVGNGGSGYSGDGGVATNATLDNPSGLAFDAYGNLFIADTLNNRVRKVAFQGPNLVLTNFFPGNAGSYDVVVTGAYGSVTSSVVNITFPLPPQNLSASLNPGHGVQVQFTGTPATAYALQATTNLLPPIHWRSVVTNLTDINGNWVFTDTNALTNSTGFYRAVLP